jgi:tetratricopeptide (TPR) repeat protein
MLGFRKGVWVVLAIVVSCLIPYSVKAQGASADQYYATATQLYSARNYAQAYQYYYAALKLNPGYAQAYQGIGNCFYALGRKADALTYYQRASQLQPTNYQLAQFVQNLRAQVAGGAAPGAGMGLSTGPNYMGQGMAYFQAKQYAASIPYFQQAARQTPNDYRPYYYAAYAYYMTGNAKMAALYFSVANMKQPNAAIQAYADRIKGNLSTEDTQWVDDQTSKYAQATGSKMPPSKVKVNFGFHMHTGMDYIISDPTQIKQYVAQAQSVSLNGVVPDTIFIPGMEFFAQIGPSFEIDLGGTYLPLGTMSYTWTDINPNDNPTQDPLMAPLVAPYYYKYDYQTSLIMANLGLKVLFGDNDVKGYFGGGVDVAPVRLKFTKTLENSAGPSPGPVADPMSLASSGDYSTTAIGGHAILGVDFYLDKGVALGPYVEYQYLDATNFTNSSGTLVVDNNNGEVKNSALASATEVTSPLDLDFSGIMAGLNITLSF